MEKGDSHNGCANWHICSSWLMPSCHHGNKSLRHVSSTPFESMLWIKTAPRTSAQYGTSRVYLIQCPIRFVYHVRLVKLQISTKLLFSSTALTDDTMLMIGSITNHRLVSSLREPPLWSCSSASFRCRRRWPLRGNQSFKSAIFRFINKWAESLNFVVTPGI